MKKKYSCVILGSDQDYLSGAAETYLKLYFNLLYSGRFPRNAVKLPNNVIEIVEKNEVDFLFSFLSPVIIPEFVLKKISIASINIHPALPKWPGVGAASFALFEGDKTYGVTAHEMLAKLDAGRIIRTIEFPILDNDSCETLFNRAMHYALILFYKIIDDIGSSGEVKYTDLKWERDAITRKEFEKWMELSPDDPPDVIMKKIKALRHSKYPGPVIELFNQRFVYPPQND